MSGMFRHESQLTDEMIAEAHALEGTPLRIEQWNHEATLDTIRHYAWGVGDDNPLYCDETYAETARHGRIVAPPSFLHSVYSGDIGVGLSGLQPVHAGYRWRYFDWVRRGDRIAVDARVGPTGVVEGRHVGRILIQTTLTDFFRRGELVAQLEGRTFRLPRTASRGGLQYEKRGATQWSAEQLEEIRQEAVSEPRRGSTPRFLEETAVGDPVPAVVKGPIDLMTMTAYYAGRAGSPGMKGVEMRWKYLTYARESPEKLPSNYDPSFFDEVVQPSLGHQIADVAHEIGMPGAYANGGQRASWFSHAITNWMGDDGDLVELEVSLRRPDIFGDVLRVAGAVTEKGPDDLVVIGLSSVNQLGEATATATAKVRLPSARL
jgi:acyl dehydratase